MLCTRLAGRVRATLPSAASESWGDRGNRTAEPSRPWSLCQRGTVASSHSLTVWSAPPEARDLPSGENARVQIGPFMSRDRGSLVAGGDLPQRDRPLLATRGQYPAVWRDGDGGKPDVPRERGQF